MKIAIVAALGLGLAALGGYAAGTMKQPAPPPAAPAPAPAPAAVRTIHVPGAPGLDAAAVQAAVRAELARQLAATEPAPEPTPEPDDVARKAAAYEHARLIVDRAVDAGRWTRDDVIALRGVMTDLGPDELDAVMAALIAPANAGRLNIQTHGSLLDPS